MLEVTGGACAGVQNVCEESFVIRWHVVRRVHVRDTVDCHGDVPVGVCSAIVAPEAMKMNAAADCIEQNSASKWITTNRWRRQLWGTGARAPSISHNFIFSSLWSKSDSQLSKYCVVCEISWCRCLQPTALSISQWLKCNGTQGNAVPPPPISGSKSSPPQIVTKIGKGTRPRIGGPNLNVLFSHLKFSTLTTAISIGLLHQSQNY